MKQAIVVVAVANREISIIHGASITDVDAEIAAEIEDATSPDVIVVISSWLLKMPIIVGITIIIDATAPPTVNTARKRRI